MLAMIGGYGMCAGAGFAFTQLQQILPFILIGIGVDDMVIITAAFVSSPTSRARPRSVATLSVCPTPMLVRFGRQRLMGPGHGRGQSRG